MLEYIIIWEIFHFYPGFIWILYSIYIHLLFESVFFSFLIFTFSFYILLLHLSFPVLHQFFIATFTMFPYVFIVFVSYIFPLFSFLLSSHSYSRFPTFFPFSQPFALFNRASTLPRTFSISLVSFTSLSKSHSLFIWYDLNDGFNGLMDTKP